MHKHTPTSQKDNSPLDHFYHYSNVLQDLLSLPTIDKSIVATKALEFLESLIRDTNLSAFDKSLLLVNTEKLDGQINLVKLTHVVNSLEVFEKLIDVLKSILVQDETTIKNVVPVLVDLTRHTDKEFVTCEICNYPVYGELVEILIEKKLHPTIMLHIAKYMVNSAYFSIPLSDKKYAQYILDELNKSASLSLLGILSLKNREGKQKYCVIGINDTADSKIAVIDVLRHVAKNYYQPECILEVLKFQISQNGTLSHYLLGYPTSNHYIMSEKWSKLSCQGQDKLTSKDTPAAPTVTKVFYNRQNSEFCTLLYDLCESGIDPKIIYKFLCIEDVYHRSIKDLSNWTESPPLSQQFLLHDVEINESELNSLSYFRRNIINHIEYLVTLNYLKYLEAIQDPKHTLHRLFLLKDPPDNSLTITSMRDNLINLKYFYVTVIGYINEKPSRDEIGIFLDKLLDSKMLNCHKFFILQLSPDKSTRQLGHVIQSFNQPELTLKYLHVIHKIHGGYSYNNTQQINAILRLLHVSNLSVTGVDGNEAGLNSFLTMKDINVPLAVFALLEGMLVEINYINPLNKKRELELDILNLLHAQIEHANKSNSNFFEMLFKDNEPAKMADELFKKYMAILTNLAKSLGDHKDCQIKLFELVAGKDITSFAIYSFITTRETPNPIHAESYLAYLMVLFDQDATPDFSLRQRIAELLSQRGKSGAHFIRSFEHDKISYETLLFCHKLSPIDDIINSRLTTMRRALRDFLMLFSDETTPSAKISTLYASVRQGALLYNYSAVFSHMPGLAYTYLDTLCNFLLINDDTYSRVFKVIEAHAFPKPGSIIFTFMGYGDISSCYFKLLKAIIKCAEKHKDKSYSLKILRHLETVIEQPKDAGKRFFEVAFSDRLSDKDSDDNNPIFQYLDLIQGLKNRTNITTPQIISLLFLKQTVTHYTRERFQKENLFLKFLKELLLASTDGKEFHNTIELFTSPEIGKLQADRDDFYKFCMALDYESTMYLFRLALEERSMHLRTLLFRQFGGPLEINNFRAMSEYGIRLACIPMHQDAPQVSEILNFLRRVETATDISLWHKFTLLSITNGKEKGNLRLIDMICRMAATALVHSYLSLVMKLYQQSLATRKTVFPQQVLKLIRLNHGYGMRTSSLTSSGYADISIAYLGILSSLILDFKDEMAIASEAIKLLSEDHQLAIRRKFNFFEALAENKNASIQNTRTPAYHYLNLIRNILKTTDYSYRNSLLDLLGRNGTTLGHLIATSDDSENIPAYFACLEDMLSIYVPARDIFDHLAQTDKSESTVGHYLAKTKYLPKYLALLYKVLHSSAVNYQHVNGASLYLLLSKKNNDGLAFKNMCNWTSEFNLVMYLLYQNAPIEPDDIAIFRNWRPRILQHVKEGSNGYPIAAMHAMLKTDSAFGKVFRLKDEPTSDISREIVTYLLDNGARPEDINPSLLPVRQPSLLTKFFQAVNVFKPAEGDDAHAIQMEGTDGAHRSDGYSADL